MLPAALHGLMLTFDIDGLENESDSPSITVTVHVLMEGGNQFALGCCTGPTSCQSSQTTVTIGEAQSYLLIRALLFE